MEQGNGNYDLVENRLQCGGLRYKSKVPRARATHRPDLSDCTIPVPIKRDRLPSPRDYQPSLKDYQTSNRNIPSSARDHSPSTKNNHSLPRDHHSLPRNYHPSSKDRSRTKDYNQSPRDQSPFLRNHHSLPRNQNTIEKDYLPSPKDESPTLRNTHSLPRNHSPSPKDYLPSPKDYHPSQRDRTPFLKNQILVTRDHNPSPRDYIPTPKDYHPTPSDHQGMLGLDDTDEQKEWRRLVGQRVCISGVKHGTLRYFGRTKFAQGHWCGVELDEPVGKHDGTVGGVVYFACRPNHGIFAPVGKVSKLNDTWDSDAICMTSTWRTESARQESSSNVHKIYSDWEYNVEKSSERKYISNSISDPTFSQGNSKHGVPRSSESFSFERRGFAETSHFPKQISVVKNSSSSRSLSKYGYTKKDQHLGSNVTQSDNAKEIHHRQHGNGISHNLGLAPAIEEYEKFLTTPTNSGQASPMSSEATAAKRFNEMPFYDYGKMPDAFQNAFQSHDFSDFEDEVDNDDQMSVDYDESLGILTPSQMKDLTLGTDFPTSLGDIRGLDFPSSESFDDINDLPEDEQVHDVSVFRVSEPSSIRGRENSKANGLSYSKNFKVPDDRKIHTSSTDKFLSSMSQKDSKGFSVEPNFTSTVSGQFSCNSSENLKQTYNSNGRASVNVICSDKINNESKDISYKYESYSKESSNISQIQNESELQRSNLTTPFSAEEHSLMEVDQNSIFCDLNDVQSKIQDIEAKAHEINEALLLPESESNAIPKEKLTVSWEDCLPRDSECAYPHVERPESVYTVGSSDTGFNEDGELECDAGMTTSVDSTDDTKRFSLASRDSCIVSDEVDVYKIAESNSTSGYSTGLSDSCCNDRADDDLSSKPLTDEEIQDSVEHCDSEDAFSFQENSLGKEGELMNMETSEVTTENITAVANNDSTSDALCETMVEDSTLTDINELLMSPEGSNNTAKSPDEAKEMDVVVEQNPVKVLKTQEKIEPVTNSQNQSTPERKPNPTRTRTAASTRSGPTSNTIRSSRTSRDEELEKRRQQAVVPKSPKKNVMSKIKAMIEATSCKSAGRVSTKSEVDQPVVIARRTVSAPKKSRWEAVTSKIAASLAEEKTKPKARREIKSRVDTNLTSARQQQTAFKSPLDSCRASNCGDGSMSPPVSVCSRDRRVLTDKNSAPSSIREGRSNLSKDSKQRPKSPRPGRITSRSASPVAASESSASLNSKLAHWKGSTSTIASSVHPPPITKRPPPLATAAKSVSVTRASVAPSARTTVNKKPLTVPKIRITPVDRSQSPASHNTRNDRNKKYSKTKEHSSSGGRPGTVKSHQAQPPPRPAAWLSKAELGAEIQRLGTLCEARTKELNRLKMETRHVGAGFDALAALFKYMVDDVNVLSVPKLSKDLEKTLKKLEVAKQDLAYYEREVEEMKAHHCQELNDLSNKLFEVFQGEVTELGTKHQEEIDRLKVEHEQQLKLTSQTYETGCEETQASHETAIMKLKQELNTQREELQLFHSKELQELEEKHSMSSKALQEHIEQLQKKCAELKHHSAGMEDAMRKDTDTKLQWVTSRKGDLEKEVESLKAVLEMKNKELHTLRVQTLEMEKQLEELPLAREKIKMLSARAEDLEALMIEKTRVERKLSTENQTIRDTYEKESKVNKRLSMENEELQWRLRQAEQSIISGSFSEVPESEELENEALSPAKSPHQMSRSVFFTFVDKDNTSSPRSQYKKITAGFSSGYKTSPSKSSRNRGLSEPMQPSSVSTPKKGVKTPSLKQKRQRASTNADNGGSFAGSMVSSVGSECSVFDQKELLEEHKEQILETLEILREQRCSEENDDRTVGDEVDKSDVVEENGKSNVAMQVVECESQNGHLKDPTQKVVGDSSSESKPLLLESEVMRFSEKNFSKSLALDGEMSFSDSSPEENSSAHGKVLKFSEITPESASEPMTPNDKWQEVVGDEMSRSAEFSDPKTYYHMTFNVMKEAGVVEGDENKVAKNENAQATHSIVESSIQVDSRVVQVSKEVFQQENGAATMETITQENILVQSYQILQNPEKDS